LGGKFHAKVNMLLSLITNKYHEGNMKRILKRELKELKKRKHHLEALFSQDLLKKNLRKAK